MLFNSFEFLFVFLPLALTGFFLLGRIGSQLALIWLAISSLSFYAWWHAPNLIVLIASVLLNYGSGRLIMGCEKPARRRVLVAATVVIDLAVLGYYKYANFFSSEVMRLFGLQWTGLDIVLPLGISFFTFTQIAYVVDASRGEVRDRSFIRYLVFVTFFPHLIAGPLLHHREMMPQFHSRSVFRPTSRFLAVGLTLFLIGLFKKVVAADSVAPWVGPVFDAPVNIALGIMQAWGAALCYSFQLYFDFSGYSDMALGLAYMIGIRMPVNFNSPYKATSIIDFWKRWHMTLSRFLRDYLYIPLGGNRHGRARRYLNLLITMLLGGLWHGAAWTFVAWGALHGVCLVVNHAWRYLAAHVGGLPWRGNWPARLLTFGVVVMGWVLFRAPSMDKAIEILTAMAGFGILGPLPELKQLAWMCGLLGLVWLAPNSQQLLSRYKPVLDRIEYSKRLAWQPNLAWGIVFIGVTLLCLGRIRKNPASEFLYFQF